VDSITGIPDVRHEHSMAILNAMDEFSEGTRFPLVSVERIRSTKGKTLRKVMGKRSGDLMA